MNGAHLTPAAEAELAHIRQMITSLTTSLDAYKKAEQDLLTKGKNDTKLPLYASLACSAVEWLSCNIDINERIKRAH